MLSRTTPPSVDPSILASFPSAGAWFLDILLPYVGVDGDESVLAGVQIQRESVERFRGI